MNFLSYMLGYFGYSKTTIGTQPYNMQSFGSNGVTGIPEQISTVYTCIDRLCKAISRMPISIYADTANGRNELKFHRLYYLLRYQPNPLQNAQTFWETVEFHRLKFGNGLVRIHKDTNTAYVTKLEIIHPLRLQEIIVQGDTMTYRVSRIDGYGTELVDSTDMLHFKAVSEDGYVGLNILEAIKRQTNINERATAHIDNFHKNNGIQNTAIETDIPGQLSGPMQGFVIESRKNYMENNGGPDNSGKPLMLPAFHKIVKLNLSFADAQLIETLKYTREEIAAAFGIPLFMIDGTAEKLDIEQLTLLFRTNTIGPIVSVYIAEIMSKLFTRDEIIIKGIRPEFDTSVIIEMDYTKKVATIKEQVVNGLMTPNEAAAKLGNKTITGDFGNKHYVQAQYIPLEDYPEYSTLQKNDPTLKTNNNNNNSNNDNKNN